MAHEVKCADTVSVLTEWNETLIVNRATNTFDDAGIATQSWTQIGSFVGDWQPVSGAVMRSEAGLSNKTVAVVIGPCNLDIEEDDQCVIPDGSIFYVNYVKNYEEHTSIFLKKTAGSLNG